MKKICILTTQDSSIKNWFEPIFDIYPPDKIEVTFITKFSNDYYSYLSNKYPEFKFINVPFPRGISFLKTIKCIAKLKKVFKKEKFDLIEYHTPNASLCASLAGRFSHIKKRIYGQWGIRFVSTKGLKRFILKKLERITCSFSTHVHAQSPKNLEYNVNNRLCKKNKISVVGIGGTIGVDFKEFDIKRKSEWRNEVRKLLNINQSDFVYGFIGRVHSDKGVNELIEAFVKNKKGKLLIIGDIDKNFPIKKENFVQLFNNEKIIYIDRVPRSDVAKYLSAIDLFVYPTYREGFGHILQEAMTMGVPVITTDVPGPSEVIENRISGLLVNAMDVTSLSNKMNFLYQNKVTLSNFAKNARKRAELHFEKSIMVSFIKIDYENLLGEKIYEV